MSTYARLYMELTDSGDLIEGDVQDAAYAGWIEIEDWNWEITRPKPTYSEDGAYESHTEPGDFTFSKLMDRATTAMLKHMSDQTLLTANVTLIQDNDISFSLMVSLDDVRITGYTLNARDEDRSTEINESWTFHYESIVLSHDPNAGRGAARGAAPTRKQAGQSRHERLASDIAPPKPREVDQVVERFSLLSEDRQKEAFTAISKAFKGGTPSPASANSPSNKPGSRATFARDKKGDS